MTHHCHLRRKPYYKTTAIKVLPNPENLGVKCINISKCLDIPTVKVTAKI